MSGCSRRSFLRLAGVGGAALTFRRFGVQKAYADWIPFNYTLIPANKNLDPAWVASLTARGTKQVFSGTDLNNIGMPIGGICCGQLYLGGDGRLWLWDIFNAPSSSVSPGSGSGPHYASPLVPDNSVDQGFALKVTANNVTTYWRLDKTGFANVTFRGEYPIGTITFADPACPVTVTLEAFSPFIPLNADDSGIPCVVLNYTVTNVSGASVAVEIAGWLQNMVCAATPNALGQLRNHVTQAADHTRIELSAEAVADTSTTVYDDFERTNYAPWTVTSGTAFGSGPVAVTNIPSYQGNVNPHGNYVVNSHASAPGTNSTQRDQAVGVLTSPTFPINFDYVDFLLGGGNHPSNTCINLKVATNTVLTATGSNANAMVNTRWDVRSLKGQTGQFEIVDNVTGGWGNIGIDYIRFVTARDNVVVADFESGTYAGWTATGTCFGSAPLNIANTPSYQGTLGAHGQYCVNSHATAPGSSIAEKDSKTGTLTSDPFVITRHFITFLIGGGNYAGVTCMNLLIGGQVVRTATGNDANAMTTKLWNVAAYEGQTAQLQIVDNGTGSWGNIGIDYIVLTDNPPGGWVDPTTASDFGTLSLALLNPQAGDHVQTGAATDTLANLFASLALNNSADATAGIGAKVAGAISRSFSLAAGASSSASFCLAWHFPKTTYATTTAGGWTSIQNIATLQRYYATRFANAGAVAAYVVTNFSSLTSSTRLWRDTWYDSTLPYWFLDRTFANTSILATNTAHRFSNGRFWGWEGLYCCAGTCTHVWQYAQAMARIFPALERDTRQRVDFGLAFNSSTGQISYRGENGTWDAVDGQAGTVLRAYREHQMSSDSTFLTANWASIKKAIQWLINTNDSDQNGILENSQGNTLDADWYGRIAWLSGLYIAACRAGAAMATEQGDTAFATQLTNIATSGAAWIENNLFWNGQYFIQLPDGSSNNTGAAYGCEIDQVFGQSYAFQVGLGRILDAAKTQTALQSLWRYNFAPDAGGFRTNASNPISGGRVYALVGESGLVMCTWPDATNVGPTGLSWTSGYFNECMTGFEHQVAAHMLWENLITYGLAIERAIHDRYAPSKRNPYNEVECSDHYARSMMSYGVFLAACGFEYHGPKKYIAFSPRLTPENFRAPFTSAAGWGTFAQNRVSNVQRHILTCRSGAIALQTLGFDLPAGATATAANVLLAGVSVSSTFSQSGTRVSIVLASAQTIAAGQELDITVQMSAPSSDGSGMADWYEQAYGLTNAAAATLDADGDGMNNLAEFISGTNPLDSNSVVKAVAVVYTGSGAQLTWSSVPGLSYAVEYSDDSGKTWHPLQSGIAATGATAQAVDAASSATRLYRVKTGGG